jgi:hypothetical protein
MKTYDLVLLSNRCIKDGRLSDRFVNVINDVMAGNKAAKRYLIMVLIDREIISDPRREQRRDEALYRSERMAEIAASDAEG